MKEQGIHWFPGHMKRAIIDIEERLKVIDVVIILIDARAPISSLNNSLIRVISKKKHFLVMTKCDYADPQKTKRSVLSFEEEGIHIVEANLFDEQAIKRIKKEVIILGEEKRLRESKKGMKPQPIRTMVVGIPNVGKSTLINKLAKRKAASVQNKPGHTKSQQWINVDKDIVLLDTPGVLASSFKDEQSAINVALIGSIKQEILPVHDLANYLLTYLKKNYCSELANHYGIEVLSQETNEEIINKIMNRRGILEDVNKAFVLLLDDFKNGLIGKISLE